MFRYAASTFRFIIGCILAGIGTIFAGAGIVMFWKEYRVQNYGVPAMATVVETQHTTETTRKTDSDRRLSGGQSKRTSSYSMTFAFTDRSDTEYRIKQGVNRELLIQFPQGAPVGIVYLPDNPKSARLSRVANPRWWVGGTAMTAIGALFALPGWFLFFGALWKSARKVKLLKTGLPVMGEVVRLRADHNTKFLGRHPHSVVYRFTGPGGQIMEGQSEWIPHRMENSFQPGTPIKVVYDTNDHQRHEPDLYGICDR